MPAHAMGSLVALCVSLPAALVAASICRAFGPRRLWCESFRGVQLPRSGGFAVCAGLLAGVAAGQRFLVGQHAGTAAVVVATIGIACAGTVDDVSGDSSAKGLRGHLSALRGGRWTTGTFKIVSISVVAAGAVRVGTGSLLTVRSGLSVVLVAGSANLANLLDVRPGRALKVVMLAAASLASRGQVALVALAGSATGFLPVDLSERALLGDAGANALGGGVGTAAALSLSLLPLAFAAGAVVALVLLGERWSYSAAIERVRLLRWADGLGRRP